jgi:hypothetical protein
MSHAAKNSMPTKTKKTTAQRRASGVGSGRMVSISSRKLATLEYIARSFIDFAENVEDYDGSNDPSMAIDTAKRMFPDWNRREMPLQC